MRILEFGKFYPPDRGGMETALRDVCRGLRGGGHRVLALVAADTTRPGLRRVDGVVVWRLARLFTVRGVPLCPSMLPALRAALRRFEPDVVHVHLPNPGAGLAWLLVGTRCPLVITYHSDIVRQRWLGRLWDPLRRRLLARAARIVVTSQALLEASPNLRAHRRRCVAIPPGVDASWYAQAAAGDVAAWRQRLGDRFFVFVGRLVYYKGLDVLLQALRDTDMRVVVVGEGPLREALEQSARKLQMGQHLRFLGQLAEEQLRALLHASAGLVLPSTAPSEAFGIVQLEAMACGRPVVAARASEGVASVHEENRTGLLVPPGDAPALRAALLRLWTDSTLGDRLGAAGRQRVREHFDLHHVTGRLVDVLGEVAQSTANHSGRSRTP